MRAAAALLLALLAGAARAEGDRVERGAQADASLEERLEASARVIPGTDIRYVIAGFVQLDGTWTRRGLAGEEKDAFLPSAIPFDAAPSDTRLNVRASQLNALMRWGELAAIAQADLFAYEEGAKPNLTQFAARYGEWLTVGKTYSTFMDEEAWPTTLDYNGPSGAVFSRQIVLRGSVPLGAALRLEAALEDPQVSGAERPDFAARLRHEGERLHAQLAGLSRSATYSAGSLQGRVSGSGISASIAVRLGEDRVLAQWSRGEGIARYFNDGLSGLGAVYDAGGELQPLRLSGAYLYGEHKWAERWTTTAGVSELRSESDGQRPASDLRRVQYASANLVHRLAKDLFLGAELLWGRAERMDFARADDTRVQLTARYYLF